MNLSSNQALEAVKNPPNQAEVKRGKDYQSRLRIWTEAYSRDTITGQTAWQEMKTYLYNTLVRAKYDALMKFVTYPFDIVNVSNDIMTDVYNVFSGRNASFDIQYQNERFKEIAEQVLNEMNIRQWMEDKGKDVLKSAPNSVTVIDLDEQGNPLLVLVHNEKIKGYEFNNDGSFKYIVFLHSKGEEGKKLWNKWALYDEEFYRVYSERDGVYSLEVENPHGLGYCPAKFFYDKPLLNKHEFDRSVPLTNTLGVMTQWQIFQWFTFYADHYGVFPIVEYADSGCGDDRCEGGVIQRQPIQNDENDVIRYTEPKACEVCANKNLIGPGTSVGIEVSEDADVQDTRGLLRFITPDVTSMEFLKVRQNERVDFLKINTVGFNNALTRDAVNEQQVRALVESRRKPLLEIKEYLNEQYKWIVKTTIKLLYDVEVNVSADFGTEFFIMTEKDILILIQEAKKSGVQSSEIAELNHLLIQTKYKNNPYKAKRMAIAADLEPSPFDTREEAEKKFAQGMITREDYYIKMNFTDLLGRFERENGSIVQFGIELPYDTKIDRIYNTLLFYTNQKLVTNEAEQIETGATGATDTVG